MVDDANAFGELLFFWQFFHPHIQVKVPFDGTLPVLGDKNCTANVQRIARGIFSISSSSKPGNPRLAARFSSKQLIRCLVIIWTIIMKGWVVSEIVDRVQR